MSQLPDTELSKQLARLKELHERGVLTDDLYRAAPAGQDDLKRGLAVVYGRLSQSQRQAVEEVLDGVRVMSATDAGSLRELRGAAHGIRRALMDLQSRGLPELNADLRRAIEEVTETVKASAEVDTGLELTIPLIPLLLSYNLNLDLGGGLDLRQAWENLQDKVRRR